jgi:Ca2+-binding RTX toxin-like protein
MFLPPISFGNTINTGNGDDFVHISKAPGIAGALGLYDVDINGHHQLMSESQLNNTTFNLGGGNDTLLVDSNVTANIHANGGSGDDVMIGGAGNDVFNGGSGDDLLWGGGGINALNGGTGDDTFINTSGVNFDNGGPGDDAFLNEGGLNFDNGGPGWDQFVNIGGWNFDHQ